MLKQWHKPKHHRYFDLNKQVKSLAFKQRHKLIKESLLTYYGSFEEMALCGVEGYGRAGYSVPVDTFLDGEVGGKRAYGQHSYNAFTRLNKISCSTYIFCYVKILSKTNLLI